MQNLRITSMFLYFRGRKGNKDSEDTMGKTVTRQVILFMFITPIFWSNCQNAYNVNISFSFCYEIR